MPKQTMFGLRSGGSLPQGPPGFPGDLGEKLFRLNCARVPCCALFVTVEGTHRATRLLA